MTAPKQGFVSLVEQANFERSVAVAEEVGTGVGVDVAVEVGDGVVE